MADKENEQLFIMLGMYVFNLLDYMTELKEVSS